MINRIKCMTPKCVGEEATAMGRGLCMKCYSAAKKLVESGNYTWDGLAAKGLCKSFKDANPFMDALRETEENG